MRGLLIVCVGATTLLLASSGNARATGPPGGQGSVPAGMHLDTHGFYHFVRLPVALTGAQQFLVQGERSSRGGCVFETRLTIAPGSPGLAQEDEAINPTTCQRLVLRGVPPANGSAGPGPRGSNVPCCGGGAAEHKGHAFAKYYDCGLCGQNTVTSETTWTDWTYDNSCVDWATNSKHNYVFTASSWFVLDDSWNNNSYNCTYTVADSKALDENLVFCAGSQTYTIYWHNAAYGWYNGNLSGYWQREADGPCAWTLGQYQDLRYDF